MLDEENRPVLTEREVLRNLQAILNDADKTPRSEVSGFSGLAVDRSGLIVGLARLLVVQSVCYLQRTGRSGPRFVAPSRATGTTARVLTSSTLRCLSSVWMTLLLIIWLSSVTTSSVERMNWRTVLRSVVILLRLEFSQSFNVDWHLYKSVV